MPKRSESFAHKVRQVMAAARGEISTIAICETLDLLGTAMRKPVYRTLQDFCRSGEAERLRPGVYRYLGKSKKPEYREIMWRILRAKRSVTVDDLVEMSGATRAYVREWLCMLVKREVVRCHKNGKYQLIKDSVKMPADDDKGRRLRKLRSRKKEVLKKLDDAWMAINDARMAVVGIEEVDDETV